MSKARVLLTRRWPDAAEKALQDAFDVTLNDSDTPMDEAALKDAMLHFDALCPCVTDRLSAAVLSVPEARVRIIGNYGVGYDHIDIEAARNAGLVVTNTPEVLTDGTADLAMTLMLMLMRRAGEGERLLRAGEWSGWYPTHLMGTEVTGKTLGIIGMGRIGLAMAKKAHYGFGMDILYHNRREMREARELKATYCADLNELLRRADVVALHCPSVPETRGLMNAERLAQMRPDAFLINTARGDVVDEAALIDALQRRVIAGAGLDVFVGEPRVNPGFLSLDNVVLLPHLGSATVETRTAMGLRVLDNLQAYFAGKAPGDQVV